MRDVPKKQGFASTILPTDGQNVKTKTEVFADMGFTHSQVQRFETLAAHPEIVAQAKTEAKTKSPTRKGDQPGRAFCNTPRYEKPIL